MDLADAHEVGAVGLVKAVQIGGVLEIVSVQIAVLQGGVGQDVVVIDDDLQVIALFGQLILHQFEDFRMGGGAGADHQGGQLVSRAGGDAERRQKQDGEQQSKNLFHGLFLLLQFYY